MTLFFYKNDRVRVMLSRFRPVFCGFSEKTNRVKYGINRANYGGIVQIMIIVLVGLVVWFEWFTTNVDVIIIYSLNKYGYYDDNSY